MGFLRQGFFYEEEPTPTPIRKTVAAQRRDILAGATGCDNCTLQASWTRNSTPRMPAWGPQDADILILGETPDDEEDRLGGAFQGADGRLINKVIPSRMKDRLAFQHMARCHPGTDNYGHTRHATPQEVHACSVHLGIDVDSRPIKAVLGIGQAVLTRIFPGAQMRQVHGTWMPAKLGQSTVWFFPVFDPTFLRIEAQPRRQQPEETAAWPVFKSDVRAFFQQLGNQKKPRITTMLKPEDILLPQTLGEAQEIYAAMEGPVAIDLETVGLRPFLTSSQLLAGSVSDGQLSMAFGIDHPDASTDWGLALILNIANSREFIAHQLQFEYMWLSFYAKHAKLSFKPAMMHDTMAIARLYHDRHRILGLDDLTRIHLGVNTKDIMNIDTKRILEYPVKQTLQYCGLDTLSCALIFGRLRDQVSQDNYRRLVDSSQAFADMTLMGLESDHAVSLELQAYWTGQMQEAEERAGTLYEVRQFERERGKWNIASAQDVGAALVDYGRLNLPKTKGQKQYATGDDILADAAGPDGHPLIDAVLGYRTAAKMKSTYIEPFLQARDLHQDGRIHPGYTVMHTATFRASSEDPNIQNFPNRNATQKALRRQVVARRGHLLVKFDYKALEARVIGMATRDKLLCQSFLTGEDIHSKWRDKALEIYPAYIDRLAVMSGADSDAKILKAGRDIIKTDFVFASFFGASADSCSKRTGIPLNYMQDLSSEFWRDFPQVKQWIRDRRNEYRDHGISRLLSGQIRHEILPGNEPINTPIQGSGAIIVLSAMNDLAALSRKLADPYLHPRINIHDDLTFELPDDDRLPQYIETIMPELVRVRFDWQTVPLAVEGAVGDSWANMEDFCNFTGDYRR